MAHTCAFQCATGLRNKFSSYFASIDVTALPPLPSPSPPSPPPSPGLLGFTPTLLIGSYCGLVIPSPQPVAGPTVSPSLLTALCYKVNRVFYLTPLFIPTDLNVPIPVTFVTVTHTAGDWLLTTVKGIDDVIKGGGSVMVVCPDGDVYASVVAAGYWGGFGGGGSFEDGLRWVKEQRGSADMERIKNFGLDEVGKGVVEGVVNGKGQGGGDKEGSGSNKHKGDNGGEAESPKRPRPSPPLLPVGMELSDKDCR